MCHRRRGPAPTRTWPDTPAGAVSSCSMSAGFTESPELGGGQAAAGLRTN